MYYYCINPWCEQRKNLKDAKNCALCGTSLLVNDRFYLVNYLRPLDRKQKDIFEVIDLRGVEHENEWKVLPGTHRVMKIAEIGDNKAWVRVQQEAQVLQHLSHPGIPKCYPGDDFTVPVSAEKIELYCLVMEKFDGLSLDRWIRSYPQIGQEKALDWLRQLTEIVDYLHKNDLLHRDIKPSNIIVSTSNRGRDNLRLVDYESVLVTTGRTDNNINEVKPNPIFMSQEGFIAPEQHYGKAYPGSDFFALGRVIVSALTQRCPNILIGENSIELDDWRSYVNKIDKPFADFLDKLMDQVPAKRPANSEVILQKVQHLRREIWWYKSLTSNFSIAFAACIVCGLGVGVYKLWYQLSYIPGESNKLLNQGIKDDTAGKTEEALSSFKKLVQINPSSAESIASFYYQQAVNAKVGDNSKKAEKEFKLAYKFNPKLSQNISDFYFRQGVKEEGSSNLEAEKDFKLAFSYNPNVAPSLSEIYFQQAKNQDDPTLAKKLYQESIKYDPTKGEAYNNLGVVCQAIDDVGCMQAAYKQAAKLKKQPWEADYNIATYFDNKQDYNQARKFYGEAKKDGSIAPQAANNLARLDILEGQYDKALKRLDWQTISRADLPYIKASIYKNIGWALLETARNNEQLVKARKSLKEANDLDPTRTDTHCLLARDEDALSLLARNEDALKLTSEALANWNFCLRSPDPVGEPEVEKWKEQVLQKLQTNKAEQ